MIVFKLIFERVIFSPTQPLIMSNTDEFLLQRRRFIGVLE